MPTARTFENVNFSNIFNNLSGIDMSKDANLTSLIKQVSEVSRQLAVVHQHNAVELLAILRLLESLHREIREDYFQEALPDNRHGLYSLLIEIEENGGWPYIDRLKIQSLLANIPPENEQAPAESA
jgi:hypothetical protein